MCIRDSYQVTSNIYAAVLAADQASPLAPELDDEKTAAEQKADAKKGDGPGGDEGGKEGADEKAAKPAAPVKPIKVDLNGIETRIVALPLPASAYISLATGLKGSLYFTEMPESGRFAGRAATLSRWVLEDRKAEKFAEGVLSFCLLYTSRCV